MIDVIRNLLCDVVNKIDAGNSAISEKDASEIITILKTYTDEENRLSKYSACKYLGLSRSTFDNKVLFGEIPHGEKTQGFKELSWRKKDLDEYLTKAKKEEKWKMS